MVRIIGAFERAAALRPGAYGPQKVFWLSRRHRASNFVSKDPSLYELGSFDSHNI
jgi:hypothetical protein